MKTVRSIRTTQIALAAALAWAVVVLPYVISFLTALLRYGDIDDWSQVLSDIPALAIIALLPVAALATAIFLSVRRLYGVDAPRDHAYAIALLVPGLVWVAFLAFAFLL